MRKLLRTTIALSILLCLTQFAHSAADSDSVMKRISQAQKSGAINTEEALLYRVFALLDPGKLPGAYRVYEKQTYKCATPVLLEVNRAWPDLSQSTKDAILPYIIKPGLIPKDPSRRMKSTYQSTLTNSYQTANFNIEWDNSPPSITEWQDSNPPNGRPDYIDNLAAYLESCWDTEIAGLGFTSPDFTTDYLFNVYVGGTGSSSPAVDLLYGYAWVYPNEAYLNGPNNMAYLVMNANYNGFGTNTDPDGQFLGAMKATAAHEFFHCVQFAYDGNEDAWIMEATATWMEDQVFDETNDYYNYIADWCLNPSVSLTFFSNNEVYQYGSTIFFQYLSEKYPSATPVKSIWESLGSNNNGSIAAIETFLSAQSTNLNTAFNDFTAKNAVMDYAEGASYGGYGVGDKMYHRDAVSSYPLTRQAVMKTYSSDLPDYLGSNYIKLTNAGAAQGIELNFNGTTSFNSKTITWSAAAVAVKSGGTYDVYELGFTGGAGQITVDSFGQGGTYEKIYFVCRVLSATGVTPSELADTTYNGYPAGVPYSFTASLTGTVVTVQPNTATLDVGDTRQFSVSGGAAPYTWVSSENSIGTIDSSGLFTAVMAGTCIVTATDNNGVSGNSGTLTVNSDNSTTTSGTDSSSSGSSDSPNPCALGTVAWSTPLQGKLNLLRKFRDTVLKRSRIGKRITNKYYELSPAFAKVIRENIMVKYLLLLPLQLIIWFLTLALESGVFPKLLLICSSLLLISSLWYRKHYNYATGIKK